MAHPSEQGPFGLPMKLSQSYGGSGEDGWGWALCDAPLLVYALLKFGLEDDPRVQRALDHLIGLVRENGWPCAVSPELGDFRGPGRKDDPCPFANLAMLKALAQSDGWRDTQAARYGAEALLDLWEHSQERHPYMFYMGTDFRKLKAPFIWYDILHTLEVLSQFAWLGVDVRLQSMAALVQTRVDGQGRFTPESIWTAWKDWDFGQKKAPSRWMTFLILRMLKRIKG
jgi:hypothetical protein